MLQSVWRLVLLLSLAPEKNVRRERRCLTAILLFFSAEEQAVTAVAVQQAHQRVITLNRLKTVELRFRRVMHPKKESCSDFSEIPEAAQLIKRCNDFGAGGVSVAIGELADGLEINLNAVLKKYDGLDGTELAISESQERMAVVVAKEDVEKFMKLAEGENLEGASVVAEVKEYLSSYSQMERQKHS